MTDKDKFFQNLFTRRIQTRTKGGHLFGFKI